MNVQPIEVQIGPQTSDMQSTIATSGTAQGLFGETFGSVLGAALPSELPKSVVPPAPFSANIATALRSGRPTEERATLIDLDPAGTKRIYTITDSISPNTQSCVGGVSGAKDTHHSDDADLDRHNTTTKAEPSAIGTVSVKPLWTALNPTTSFAGGNAVNIIADSSAKLKSPVTSRTPASPPTTKTGVQQNSVTNEVAAKIIPIDAKNSNDCSYTTTPSPTGNISVTVNSAEGLPAADTKLISSDADNSLFEIAPSKAVAQPATVSVPLRSAPPKTISSSTLNVHTNTLSIQHDLSQTLPLDNALSVNPSSLPVPSFSPHEQAGLKPDTVIFIAEKPNLEVRASGASIQGVPSKSDILFEAVIAADSAVTTRAGDLNAGTKAAENTAASTVVPPQNLFSTKSVATLSQNTLPSSLARKEDSHDSQITGVPSAFGATVTENHGTDGIASRASSATSAAVKSAHSIANETEVITLSAVTKNTVPTSPIPGTANKVSSQAVSDQVPPTSAYKTNGSAGRPFLPDVSLASANADKPLATSPVASIENISPQIVTTKPIATRSVVTGPSETSPPPAATQIDQAVGHFTSTVPIGAPRIVANDVSQSIVTPAVPLTAPASTRQATVEVVSSVSNLLGPATSSQRAVLSDPLISQVSHTTLVSTPTTLEIGLPNGTQGWLKIRAEVSNEGTINASLSAATNAAQESLHRQLPALNAYLHGEQMAVTTSIADRVFAAPNTSFGAGTTSSNNSSGSDSSARSWAQNVGTQDGGAQHADTASNSRHNARDNYATSIPDALPDASARRYDSVSDLQTIAVSQTSPNGTNGRLLNIRV